MLFFFLLLFFLGGGGGGVRGEEGSSVSELFFTKNPNLKKEKLGRGEGGCVVGCTDKQAQTNLPLQLLRSWGHNDE